MARLAARRWRSVEPRALFGDFGSLWREIDALFDDAFATRATRRDTWAPRLDTAVENDTLRVRADLPGVDPKAVEITVDDGVLTIRGERTGVQGQAAYREVPYGRFERRIRVPRDTDTRAITATYTNGVLDVSIPLRKPTSRKIPVDVGGATA
jgi:HSP20 family protein